MRSKCRIYSLLIAGMCRLHMTAGPQQLSRDFECANSIRSKELQSANLPECKVMLRGYRCRILREHYQVEPCSFHPQKMIDHPEAPNRTGRSGSEGLVFEAKAREATAGSNLGTPSLRLVWLQQSCTSRCTSQITLTLRCRDCIRIRYA